MTNLINDIQNNALAALAQRAPTHIMHDIKKASMKTGVNFAYLVQQAEAESSFNPAAKAKTSSASGLYQFIEKTWLNMIEKHGAKHGIVTDGKTRGELLDLRNDPRAASLMAAEFANENKNFLQTHTKGEVGSTELYFAHFLGAGQAAAFLNARQDNPLQKAAYLFPAAAKANRNVFYDTTTGRPKTLDEVYAYFDKKFEIEGDLTPQDTPTQIAAAKPQPNGSLYTPAPVDTDYLKFMETGRQMQRASLGAIGGGYQTLFSNPLEIMLLTQMDLPDSTKNDNTQLFSQRALF
jgi:hypothetical protein